MTFRIFVKSLFLAIRSGKRFIIFVITYAIMIWLIANQMNSLINGGDVVALVIFLAIMAALAFSYGIIISNYRKVQVATLRCLGWTSADIKWLFIGELMLVCGVATFVDLEIVVHYIGIVANFTKTIPVIFDSTAFLIAVGLVVAVQFLGVFTAYNRMLKVRPMEALRKA